MGIYMRNRIKARVPEIRSKYIANEKEILEWRNVLERPSREEIEEKSRNWSVKNSFKRYGELKFQREEKKNFIYNKINEEKDWIEKKWEAIKNDFRKLSEISDSREKIKLVTDIF